MLHILCTICRGIVNDVNNISATRCGHVFHHTCLTQWIAISPSCPHCRSTATDKNIIRLHLTLAKDHTEEARAAIRAILDGERRQ